MGGNHGPADHLPGGLAARLAAEALIARHAATAIFAIDDTGLCRLRSRGEMAGLEMSCL